MKPAQTLLLLIAVLFGAVWSGAQPVLAQAPDPERVLVRILAEAEVYGDSYTLGEIAEMDGFDIELMRTLGGLEVGRAPLPGRSLRLSESTIRARIRRATGSASRVILSMPKQAKVTRAALRVPGEAIAGMVLEFAAAEAGVSPDDLQQNVRGDTPDAVLPKGDPEWHISALGRNASPSGERTFLVVARIDGRDAWRTTVRLHQKVYQEVVLAARTIRRNATITASDLRIERRPLRGSRSDDLAGSLEQVVGRKARRAIGPNETIRKNLLTEPHTIEEGGRVVVMFQTDRVQLQVAGVALVSGHVGDFIPVKNLQSGKVVYGVVEAAELVRVN